MADQKLNWWIAFFGGSLGVVLTAGLDFLPEVLRKTIFIVACCFTLLSLFMLSLRSPAGQKLIRWKDRKKRERKQTYYRMVRGQHSREEEGVRKFYSEGDVIGLTDEEFKEYGKDRMEGPIDIKKWRRLNKGRREGSDKPG